MDRFEVTEVGYFKPGIVSVDSLDAGHVGFFAASIKNVRDARVGDTVTGVANPADKPLSGYRKATPMVYCGLYPVENSDYDNLRDALEKLQLNDASLVFEPATASFPLLSESHILAENEPASSGLSGLL